MVKQKTISTIMVCIMTCSLVMSTATLLSVDLKTVNPNTIQVHSQNTKEKKNLAEKSIKFIGKTWKNNIGKFFLITAGLLSYKAFPNFTKLGLLGTGLYMFNKLVLNRDPKKTTWAESISKDWEGVKNYFDFQTSNKTKKTNTIKNN